MGTYNPAIDATLKRQRHLRNPSFFISAKWYTNLSAY